MANDPQISDPTWLVGRAWCPFNELAFDTHRNTIIGGFIALAVIYFIGWELILAA